MAREEEEEESASKQITTRFNSNRRKAESSTYSIRHWSIDMEQSWKMFRQRDLTRRFLHCSPTTTATNVNTDALCSNELMFARNNVNGSIIKPIPMNGCECTIRTATTLTSKSGTDIECKLSHRTTTTMDHYDDQRRLASRRTIIGPGKYTLVMMITFFFILVLQHFPSCK
ncbi:hypothetical protein BLOT_006484 [Blomia tropicalis]|nr:hypothetical protein BLOT_006484 [Blomia tropicalis]